jgi:hypothetical protein
MSPMGHSRTFAGSDAMSVYPRKRTLEVCSGMSARGQFRTHAPQQTHAGQSNVQLEVGCGTNAIGRKRMKPDAPLLSPEPTSFLDECLDKATNSNEAFAVSRVTQNDQVGLLEPGWDMKFVTSLLAAALLLAGAGVSHASVRIADDRGGRIGNYVTKFQRLRSSGESVIIDGLCASACTLVLGTVPHNKICVTSRRDARLPRRL